MLQSAGRGKVPECQAQHQKLQHHSAGLHEAVALCLSKRCSGLCSHGRWVLQEAFIRFEEMDHDEKDSYLFFRTVCASPMSPALVVCFANLSERVFFSLYSAHAVNTNIIFIQINIYIYIFNIRLFIHMCVQYVLT